LVTDEQLRSARDDARRKMRQWHTAEDLADKMLARAALDKRVTLSPATAEYVARLLKREAEWP